MKLLGSGAKPLVARWQIVLALALAFGLLLYIESRGHSAEYLPSIWFVTLTRAGQLPFLIWLLLFPLFCLAPRVEIPRHNSTDRPPNARSRFIISILLGLLGVGVAAWFGWDIRDLPPRVHDEYSYLLQAETFLEGRFTWPAPPANEHFHEVHVLMADGSLASRYFPATGAWIAPFLAIGCPMLAGWLAQGVISGFMAAAASRYSLVAGLTTGILVSTCPALVIFGNTFLSPHPTMMGLAVAWWAFEESLLSRKRRWSIIVGLGTGWAFLARPLTAAAIAGPWGLYVLWRSVGSPSLRRHVAWMVVGFLPAVLIMAVYNHAITGDISVTPYGKYTAVYTPSHVYGFYNRTRGIADHGPRTIDAFEDWVAELTPERSVHLLFQRWENALPYMGGCIPTVILFTLAVFSLSAPGDRVLLPLLSIATLSLAYVPYFFEGVMGFSYIIEAMPWVLLLMSYAFSRVVESVILQGRNGLALWWTLLLAITTTMNLLFTLPNALSPDGELVHPRIEAAQRISKEKELCGHERCLILYDISQKGDLHVMWVNNHPSFDAPIIRGLALDDIEPVLKAFPNRKVFLSRNGRYEQIR